MPLLDISELVSDPDFCELRLICSRMTQVIGENGLAVNTPVRIPFVGVVTQVSGAELERNAVGELITGTILVCTRFRLTDGKAGTTGPPQTGTTADIVQWGPRTYTVINVYNYSRFGRGVIEAVCDLLPLAGSVAGAYDPPACA
jgi:galactose-6-phosphate isomerase